LSNCLAFGLEIPSGGVVDSGKITASLDITNLSPPVITINPVSQTIGSGGSVLFEVLATGTPPLNYQWFFNGQPITNATGTFFGISNVQLENAGNYFATVANFFGSVTSSVAALRVDGANAFGVVGTPFQYQIAANNNPTGFTASGLPPGLRCDVASGLIFGTPTGVGSFAVRVEARSIFTSVSGTIVIVIKQGAITSPTSPEGIVGVPFSYQITANNSPNRYFASSLPSGLHFDGTFGVISGTPSTAGTYSVVIQARNNYGSVSETIFININEGAITSAGSAIGVVSVPFTYQVTANNIPNRYSASGLPPGLRFDSTFGVISGTPITSGSFQVHLEARNNYGSAFGEVFITIQDVAIITGTVSAPALKIARSGNDFLVSWPAASSGFVLEEAGLAQNTWSNSSATIGIAASENVVSVPLKNTAKFFRLRKLSK
jgi:hypothetical protein